jgi:predicted TIM-barrel fold metal-dependent hydrolase
LLFNLRIPRRTKQTLGGAKNFVKRIDLEAHFITKEYVKAMQENKGYPHYGPHPKTGNRQLYYSPFVGEPLGDPQLDKLLDLDEGRIAMMDKAGLDMQVLSLSSPGAEQFEPALGKTLAREANDTLYEAIQRHPSRYLGFAALAIQDPADAANELERAVKKLGLKGWKTHSNYAGKYLDDEEFWPILAMAEKLDAPVYLHPAMPAIIQLQKYGFAMAGAPFGFGIDTAICMMRLIYGGVLDRYPKLKIFLGHLGEGMPFLIQRINFAYVRPWFDIEARPKLNRKPGEYFKENVFVTTSGNYLPAAFKCTQEVMGTDHIFLASDYPYEDPVECMQFLGGLRLTEQERAQVYSGNAIRLGITE